MTWLLHLYYLLQVMSLAFDGITGGAQDKIRDEHHPAAHSMMVWMNVWSVSYLVIGELACHIIWRVILVD